ncbi:MAG: hypothetical protein WCI18_09135 [Pseudomonadota bacterium]
MKFFVPITMILFSMSCGSGGVIKSKSSSLPKTAGGDVKASGDWNSAYLAGYESEILPFAVKNCGSCHGETIAPKFAASDAKESAKAALDGHKLDFVDIDASRLILRLTQDQHNCGEKAECQALGAELKAKIAALVAKLPAQTSTTREIPQTPTQDFTNLVDSDRVIASPSFLIVEAESLIPAGATAPLASTVEGSTTYVKMPATTTNFTAPVTTVLGGKYYVWARYRRAAQGAMTANFSYNSDAVPPVAVNRAFPVVDTKGAFRMSPLNQLAQGIPGPYIMPTPQTISVTLAMSVLDLDMIIFTDVDYSKRVEKEPTITKKVLNFDLTSMGVPGGRIEIAASVIDPEGSKTYNFEAPRYFGPQNAKIKGMKILVNGKWNPVSSQFTALDTVVAKGEYLSTNAMTVASDKGVEADKFSLTFEEIAPK